MDVGILGDIISDILQGMSSLTTSATGLSSSDTHQLENLVELLTEIHQDVVRKAKQNHKQGPNEFLHWLEKLKDVVNDLSDLVEDLCADASRQKENTTGTGKDMTKRIRSFLSRSNPISNRLKVTYQIRKVTEELKGVASKAKELPLFEKMVGREKEKKEIIDQLILFRNKTRESAIPVHVVTIVGVAGIGKTKLAELICGDEEVKRHFDLPIWVNGVNETFVVKSIAKSVIKSAATDRKFYLLVLDDLKFQISEECLMTLQQKLTEAGAGLSGGVILITTRSNLVAKIAASKVKTYALQGLNEDESWSLFQQIRGRGGASDSTNSIIQNIERKIVGNCGGVPLAIIIIARLMNYRGSPVADAEVAELNEFLQKQEFAYYDELPTHQKQCFAYCSLFPEDYLIDAERLIHLWMGEGFLTPWNIPNSSSDSAEAEEIGREYFNDFLERSIFQAVKEDECGVVTSCRMNRVMHDLASVVAGEENTIIDSVSDGHKVHDRVLRASIYFSLDVSCGIPDSMFEKAKKLRTILLPAKNQSRLPHEVKMSTSTCDEIFTSFKCLRVMDLHDLGIKMVPSSIGELKILRYLDLSENNIEKLPGSITKLSHLQTLKLSQCHVLKELPKDLEDLSSLRHLDIDGCLDLTHMPRGTKKLTSLQTLSLFVASKTYHMGGLRELTDLNNLRGHLEILHLEQVKFSASSDAEFKDAYLKKKQHLQRLTLRWDHEDDEEEEDNDEKDKKSLECLEPHPNLRVLFVVGYNGQTFSNWLSSIQCLVKFSLNDCPRCQFLAPLDQLPFLKILELRRLDSLEFIEENRDNTSGDTDGRSNDIEGSSSSNFSINTPTVPFFPSLKELTISDCPNLRSWWKKENMDNDRPFFTCISKLQVQYCPKLTCMPLYPHLDEELVLVDSSVRPMRDTIHSKTSEAFVPLSKLKSMLIASIEHSPPERWLRNFTSLENLHIRECHHLESLPQGFKHLSSLQCLTIERCPKLDLDRSKTEWEGLKNLRSLTIREIPNLESLPWGVENVTSLQDLGLYDCHALTFLPESIGNLTSLGRLVISECKRLDSLPKGMEKLKSLHTLIITDCPLLLPRCQPETGDDWPQIVHIRSILLKQTSQELKDL